MAWTGYTCFVASLFKSVVHTTLHSLILNTSAKNTIGFEGTGCGNNLHFECLYPDHYCLTLFSLIGNVVIIFTYLNLVVFSFTSLLEFPL